MRQLETACPGCGALFSTVEGPTHDYMLSSPACFAAFCSLLAAEYSSETLREVHRLTVDTWAVQHPGDPDDRRAVQSVGLHLARLKLQLDTPSPPAETNAAMLEFSKHKATLPVLSAPEGFRVTASDVVATAGTADHVEAVRTWARQTWEDWSDHHAFITGWLSQYRST